MIARALEISEPCSRAFVFSSLAKLCTSVQDAFSPSLSGACQGCNRESAQKETPDPCHLQCLPKNQVIAKSLALLLLLDNLCNPACCKQRGSYQRTSIL